MLLCVSVSRLVELPVVDDEAAVAAEHNSTNISSVERQRRATISLAAASPEFKSPASTAHQYRYAIDTLSLVVQML
jgi:hypothetical protein